MFQEYLCEAWIDHYHVKADRPHQDKGGLELWLQLSRVNR